ncbi:MAG: hypothetical protein Q4D55_09540 [Eubacteriales bacterium]|nr:hypothetical protein [Eubacteriales bacterium]
MGLTMLENGLDFVIDAIFHLKQAEQDDCRNKEQEIKYSLLHLSSGIELILKSRLFREHWTYIFSDMNKANKSNLKNGSFRSVESGVLIERLERLCDVPVDKESKNVLENLRRLRNQMEHFTIKDHFPAIESCINHSLGAINKFITENYNDFTSPISISLKDDDETFGLTKQEEMLIEELIKRTAELKEHYEDALKMAAAKARDETLLDELVECPSCKEKFLKCNYDNNKCHCFFCAYEEEGEKAANEYLSVIQGLDSYEIVKSGGEYPLYNCPDCGNDSFVNTNGKYLCFSCGICYDEDEIAFCNECGALYIKEEDDWELCPSCIENKMAE